MPFRTSFPRGRSTALALLLGILCHTLFAAAVAIMARELWQGMPHGYMPFRWPQAVLYNVFLLIQFPIIHSFLLTRRGGLFLERAVPGPKGRDLMTTTYAIVSTLQLIAVFTLWAPSHYVVWEAHGPLRAAFGVLYISSWLFLVKSMIDAGMGVQTGFLGWSSVLRNKPVKYPAFEPRGAFAYCRHPMYLAFVMILWTSAVVTPDRLLAACLWSIYLYFGPRLKEARYLRRYGERFAEYQRTVPYWLPAPSPVAVRAEGERLR